MYLKIPKFNGVKQLLGPNTKPKPKRDVKRWPNNPTASNYKTASFFHKISFSFFCLHFLSLLATTLTHCCWCKCVFLPLLNSLSFSLSSSIPSTISATSYQGRNKKKKKKLKNSIQPGSGLNDSYQNQNAL